MHALPCMAGDEFNVHFMVVILVEKGGVTSASNSAGLHHSAYATVENVLVLSRDLGSEDRRRGLPSGYF